MTMVVGFLKASKLKVREEWVSWCSWCWAMGDAFIWAFDNARRKTFFLYFLLLLLYIGIKEDEKKQVSIQNQQKGRGCGWFMNSNFSGFEWWRIVYIYRYT